MSTKLMDVKVLNYEESRTKQAHRETILMESFQLFIKNGIHYVTMDDIAQASKMTLRSIYNYYNSKEEIAIDLQIMAINELQKAKTSRLEFENGFLETAYWIRFFGRWFMEHQEITTYLTMFDYAFVTSYPNYRLVEFLNENNVGHIIYESINRGVQDGSIIQIDPSKLAYTIAQMAFAYVQKYIFHQVVSTFEPITDQIGNYELFIELIINSLRNTTKA
jgi:AcrR family transcriptional regulator